MQTIAEQKKALRRQLIAARRAIDPQTKKQLDTAIFNAITGLERYKSAELILTYLSTPEEADTAALINFALSEGRRVALPRVNRQVGKLEFYVINHLSGLVPSEFASIMEPQPEPGRLVLAYKNSVCIVPALAATRVGFRLGYGGGYYDRFLSTYSGFSAIPLYSRFLAESLPCEPFDIPVDAVVTEDAVFLNKE